MTRSVDLTAQAPALTALAGQVALASGGAGLGALGSQALALGPALAGAPATTVPTEWVATVDDDGLLAVGPGVEVIVDGPAVAPRAVHVLVGERALLVVPQATGQHARLLDGTNVVADVTFSLTGGAVDHLDAAAAAQRALDRVGRALDQRADDPYEATEPAVSDLAGTVTGGGGGTGAATLLAGALGTAAAAGAAVAATRGRRRPAPLGEWTATHVVPDGGLGARRTADATAPLADRLEAGVQLRVVRRWGDWAEVDTAGGWSGWVDARRLVPID